MPGQTGPDRRAFFRNEEQAILHRQSTGEFPCRLDHTLRPDEFFVDCALLFLRPFSLRFFYDNVEESLAYEQLEI